tara:strand:+ start:376 stop:861 length:486 start_codon:yes stop_codon:yes gene_type:complete
MYEVGNIIFLVSRKAQSVLAAQICEQNVKKTLDGEETTFRVRIGTGDESDTELYDLDRIDADIYSSPEEATQSLYETAKSVIDSLVNDAVDDATKFFSYKQLPIKKTTKSRSRKSSTKKTSTKSATKASSPPVKDDALYVTMPDGTQAKLKTPIDNITPAS